MLTALTFQYSLEWFKYSEFHWNYENHLQHVLTLNYIHILKWYELRIPQISCKNSIEWLEYYWNHENIK